MSEAFRKMYLANVFSEMYLAKSFAHFNILSFIFYFYVLKEFSPKKKIMQSRGDKY